MLPTNLRVVGATDERLLELTGAELGVTELGATELRGAELGAIELEATELLTLETGAELGGVEDLTEDTGAAPQRVPLMVGRSAALAPLVPWNPKDTDWPTAMLPFQETLVAV